MHSNRSVLISLEIELHMYTIFKQKIPMDNGTSLQQKEEKETYSPYWKKGADEHSYMFIAVVS